MSPNASSAPPARASFHHGDLRRALVRAAEDLVVERGADGVTLRGAAARAGVSSAAPYRHFPDKDALLVEVALRGYDALQRHVLAAPNTPGTIEAVHTLVLAYAGFALDHPQLYRLMMGTGITDRARFTDLTAAHDTTCAILVDAVAETQRHGGIVDQDPVAVAVTLWCMVHGLAMLVIDGRIVAGDVATEVERSLRIVDDGLRPREER